MTHSLKITNSLTRQKEIFKPIPANFPILDGLTEYAINYFKDKVEPNKKFKKPNLNEKNFMFNLIRCAKNMRIILSESPYA